MENILNDINSFINVIVASGWMPIVLLLITLGVVYWIINAAKPVYKELSLVYNPILAAILAIMAGIVDFFQPNRYKSRGPKEIIIQFLTMVVAISFAIILVFLVMINWDTVVQIIQG